MKIVLLTIFLGVLLVGANTQDIEEVEACKIHSSKKTGAPALEEIEDFIGGPPHRPIKNQTNGPYHSHHTKSADSNSKQKQTLDEIEAYIGSLPHRPIKNQTNGPHHNHHTKSADSNNKQKQTLDEIEAYIGSLPHRPIKNQTNGPHHNHHTKSADSNNKQKQTLDEIEAYIGGMPRKHKHTHSQTDASKYKSNSVLEAYVFGLHPRYKLDKNLTQKTQKIPREIEDFKYPLHPNKTKGGNKGSDAIIVPKHAKGHFKYDNILAGMPLGFNSAVSAARMNRSRPDGTIRGNAPSSHNLRKDKTKESPKNKQINKQ